MQASIVAFSQWSDGSTGYSGSSQGRAALLVAGTSLYWLYAWSQQTRCAEDDSAPLPAAVGTTATASTRLIRRAEVAQHNNKQSGIWTLYQNKVYDITKFVANHPGGQDKIMLAAGNSVEPFWQLYPIHSKSKLPMELLRGMEIGSLHPDDVAAEESARAKEADRIGDPYADEPKPSPLLLFHMQKPLNAEAPNSLLTDNWITPLELWFVRNHHPVPDTKEEDYRLSVTLPDGRTLEYSLRDLKTLFKKHNVVSTIQCGGNRRSEMNIPGKSTSGSPWQCGALSTAKWSGVRLSDLLLKAGVNYYNAEDMGLKHVQFLAIDDMGASIPIKKAVDIHGDVLLAYEMNDEPLPRYHGYPVRAIIPGHVGVRNVKWVKQVTLSDEEAAGPWQRGMSYKGFGPSTTSLEGLDVERIPSLQEQPVQSAIMVPRNGTVWTAGDVVTMKGYAYSGGGRGIVRVDVSVDNGKTWKTAELAEGSQQPLDRAWAWTFWSLDVEVPESIVGQEINLICKATDASYNVQPESVDGIWNLRGINNNSWSRVNVMVGSDEGDDESQ